MAFFPGKKYLPFPVVPFVCVAVHLPGEGTGSKAACTECFFAPRSSSQKELFWIGWVLLSQGYAWKEMGLGCNVSWKHKLFNTNQLVGSVTLGVLVTFTVHCMEMSFTWEVFWWWDPDFDIISPWLTHPSYIHIQHMYVCMILMILGKSKGFQPLIYISQVNMRMDTMLNCGWEKFETHLK